MTESRGLPFGRPSGQAPQTQFIDERRRSVPKADGWVLSAIGSDNFSELAAAAMGTANLVRFARLPILDRDYHITKASLNVTTGSAAQQFRCGVYQYADSKLLLVPASSASFAAGTTGIQTTSTAFRLYAGGQYFIAGMCTDTIAQCVCAQGNNPTVETILTYSSATLPAQISTASTVKSRTAQSVPLVTYYSATAYALLG